MRIVELERRDRYTILAREIAKRARSVEGLVEEFCHSAEGATVSGFHSSVIKFSSKTDCNFLQGCRGYPEHAKRHCPIFLLLMQF